MPAGAALSSSSRQRNKAGQSTSRRNAGGRGPGLSRDHGSSRRAGSSQRNLMRPTEALVRARECEGLTESMPALTEGREKLLDSLRGGLDDSTKSNPELFLTRSEDPLDESFTIELRQRSFVRYPANYSQRGGSQNLESGGGQNNLHSEELTPTQNKHPVEKSSSMKKTDKDAPPTEENRCPPWYLKPCNVARKFIGRIVNDPWVQNTVLLMIVVNAVMMGIATFPSIKSNPVVLNKFEICDQIFLIIFTIESSMQLIYRGWTLFKDGFLVFDLLIVVMSWALEGAQVFRAFRIFRAMRLITRIDTLKNLVLALFSVVPKMTAIFMLLLLIFYIFAVMFTQLFKGMFEEDLVEAPYFETIYGSLFTLFQMMTLDEWAAILIQIQVEYPWAWMPFVVFIIITGFVVVNLIIAVICDAVHVLGNENKVGLHGYESEPGSTDEIQNPLEEEEFISTANTTDRRIEQLQLQLDEMVIVQEQMKETIELLIKKLQENAATQTPSLPAQTDSGQQYLTASLLAQEDFRESLSNSFGEDDPPDQQVSHARSMSIPDDSRGQNLGSKTL